MKLLYVLLTFVLVLLSSPSYSQSYANPNHYLIDSLDFDKLSENEQFLIDSCLTLFHNTHQDTSRLGIINIIVEESWDDNVWPKYNYWVYKKVKELLKKENNPQVTEYLKKAHSGSLNNIGYFFQRQGDNDQALDFYLQGIEIKKEIGDKQGLADTYNNIGSLHNMQGAIKNALIYYKKSLKLYEALNNKRGVAYTYNNIGIIHKNQGDIPTALEYYLKSLKIKEEIGDLQGMAASYNNIGFIHNIQGNNYKALDYYTKSLKLQKEIGDKDAIANSYNNIGFIYDNLDQNKIALEYYEKSLIINKAIKDRQGMANSYNNIGSLYLKLNNIHQAAIYATKSLQLAKEIGYPNEIKTASKLLSEIYKRQGKGLLALEMYKTYITMKDSIDNDNNTKAAFKQNMQYKYSKKTFTDSIKTAQTLKIINAEIKVKETINKQQKKQQLYLFGIIFLMILLAGFTYNRFKITKKQKFIITKQKLFVEKAHKEIRDSINYAERIQRSFLATQSTLNSNLDDYFVFFRPKDVVSGDFYWANMLNNGTFVMVNADSTGHGIPGAIMSILNISSIEKAIDKGYTLPADIFNDTRKTIITRLKNDGSKDGGRDGMDASIICYDFNNLKMTYCVAKNPIWIIRNSKLIQLKPEKMPVGKHDYDHIPFVGGEFGLQKGDQIYTLTDGFQDQFGGPKRKKFMVKRLRQLIIDIAHLPLKEQQLKLKEAFDNWKKGVEQIDDVCIIGIKV